MYSYYCSLGTPSRDTVTIKYENIHTKWSFNKHAYIHTYIIKQCSDFGFSCCAFAVRIHNANLSSFAGEKKCANILSEPLCMYILVFCISCRIQTVMGNTKSDE